MARHQSTAEPAASGRTTDNLSHATIPNLDCRGRSSGHIFGHMRFLRRIWARRRTESIVSIVVFGVAVALFILAIARPQTWDGRLADKLSMAVIVALGVRFINLAFGEVHTYDESSKDEYYAALRAARKRILICQTWLPGTEEEALRIVRAEAPDTRILLASMHERSFIHARILGRGISADEAKYAICLSVRRFILAGKKADIKFNRCHHPAWFAIIDNDVFWGPTPVNIDNHANDFLFHRHDVGSEKGKFWEDQFDVLWNGSHKLPDGTEQPFSVTFDEECNENKSLCLIAG